MIHTRYPSSMSAKTPIMEGWSLPGRSGELTCCEAAFLPQLSSLGGTPLRAALAHGQCLGRILALRQRAGGLSVLGTALGHLALHDGWIVAGMSEGRYGGGPEGQNGSEADHSVGGLRVRMLCFAGSANTERKSITSSKRWCVEVYPHHRQDRFVLGNVWLFIYVRPNMHVGFIEHGFLRGHAYYYEYLQCRSRKGNEDPVFCMCILELSSTMRL